MSKAVKNLMIRDYQERLTGISDALVISIRGVGAIDNNKMRLDLRKKNVRITVMRNNLASYAMKGTALAGLEKIMTGPTALAYGGAGVIDAARAIVEWAKKIEKLELKGAILDGVLFEGKAGVVELSRFPTKKEAQSTVVSLILGPGGKVMGQVRGPGGKVMGIVKSVQEKLEKGEAISRIA